MVVLHNSSTVSDRWHRGTLPHELTHKYSPPHLLSGPIHDCTVKIDMGPEMASRDLVTLFLRAENFQRRIQMESTITINQALKNKALIHWLLLVLLSWAFFFGCKILFLSCTSCSFITTEELYLGSRICFTILKPEDEKGACRSGVPELRPRVIFVHQWHKLALAKMHQIKSSKGKRGNTKTVEGSQTTSKIKLLLKEKP